MNCTVELVLCKWRPNILVWSLEMDRIHVGHRKGKWFGELQSSSKLDVTKKRQHSDQPIRPESISCALMIENILLARSLQACQTFYLDMSGVSLADWPKIRVQSHKSSDIFCQNWIVRTAAPLERLSSVVNSSGSGGRRPNGRIIRRSLFPELDIDFSGTWHRKSTYSGMEDKQWPRIRG